MVLFPRLRDGVLLYYVILGCAVMSLYLFFRSDLHSSTGADNIGYVNLTRRNYQYDEVCREWKLALDQEKSPNNENSLDEKFKPKLDSWDDSELSSHFLCDNSYRQKHISQRGAYYVIYNFVRAETEFECTSSVTLSAPGDYRFLDNVVPLVEHWQGPVSIALYAPGQDFFTTIRAIAYLRNCETDLVKQLVTFHIFFDQEHTPKHNRTSIFDAYTDSYDCFFPPPWHDANDEDMYKTKNKLLYPINVARNVAKVASQTYFVFPSDIELYPTKHFIPSFLKFVKQNLELFAPDTRNVFVLPIFEVWANQKIPENKTELQAMLKKKTAIVFHQTVCMVCHRVIDSEKWIKAPETEGLSVFSVGKRIGRHMVWEPFFVCTQNEPLWDERMTWEGQNNKMVQAFTMCIMKYNFHVLDNAFLIHKPGVKKKKVQVQKFNNVVQTSNKLIKKIALEVQELYGYNKNCSTTYKSVVKQKPKSAEKTPDKKEEKVIDKKPAKTIDKEVEIEKKVKTEEKKVETEEKKVETKKKVVKEPEK